MFWSFQEISVGGSIFVRKITFFTTQLNQSNEMKSLQPNEHK